MEVPYFKVYGVTNRPQSVECLKHHTHVFLAYVTSSNESLLLAGGFSPCSNSETYVLYN